MTNPTDRPVVIVTGSSGYVGSAVVKRLAAHYRVVGFDRHAPPHPPPEAECVCFDITDESSIDAALSRVRIAYGDRIASVIRLAAYFDLSREPSPAYDAFTMHGTERLLAGLKAFDLEQFVFTSTMLVHAPTTRGRRIAEDSDMLVRMLCTRCALLIALLTAVSARAEVSKPVGVWVDARQRIKVEIAPCDVRRMPRVCHSSISRIRILRSAAGPSRGSGYSTVSAAVAEARGVTAGSTTPTMALTTTWRCRLATMAPCASAPIVSSRSSARRLSGRAPVKDQRLAAWNIVSSQPSTTGRRFRSGSRGDPSVLQEEQDDEPADPGAAVYDPAPTQHAVRIRNRVHQPAGRFR